MPWGASPEAAHPVPPALSQPYITHILNHYHPITRRNHEKTLGFERVARPVSATPVCTFAAVELNRRLSPVVPVPVPELARTRPNSPELARNRARARARARIRHPMGWL